MAKQVGTFVDDNRLRPRDNSGGPMGPQHSTDFGEHGGKVGEPMNDRGGGEDEFKMKYRPAVKRPATTVTVSRKGGY